eukprot:758235-Hanusia_phi.AAC.4
MPRQLAQGRGTSESAYIRRPIYQPGLVAAVEGGDLEGRRSQEGGGARSQALLGESLSTGGERSGG